MVTEHEKSADNIDIPASLRRKGKEPSKLLQFRLPLSWWEELNSLAKEYDQDVSTFLREATEDWLRRARKVRQATSSAPNPPSTSLPI
jgi:hypothetical protein